MSALLPLLLARIGAGGPLKLSDYMAECLLNPAHGYYATRDPFGAAGDFITAPEISQMFGELIGLALAQSWLDQGAPKRFVLAEIGPGRGTLMADILRACRKVPGFLEAAEVWLIEASAHLRKVQRQTLGAAKVTWADEVSALPKDAPLFLVANEFFDALPIRQFIRDGGAWAERLIGASEEKLIWGRAEAAPVPALDYRLADTKDGDLVEFCPAAPAIMAEIGARIAAHGGAALIIDYGDWRSLGDTLQALSKHHYADPFEAPGTADLTAHVDFEALSRAVPGLNRGALTGQGAFLRRLGIEQRAGILARQMRPEAAERHFAALHRLTAPAEMGTLFKVLALVPRGAPLPPGIAAPEDPHELLHHA